MISIEGNCMLLRRMFFFVIEMYKSNDQDKIINFFSEFPRELK